MDMKAAKKLLIIIGIILAGIGIAIIVPPIIILSSLSGMCGGFQKKVDAQVASYEGSIADSGLLVSSEVHTNGDCLTAGTMDIEFTVNKVYDSPRVAIDELVSVVERANIPTGHEEVSLSDVGVPYVKVSGGRVDEVSGDIEKKSYHLQVSYDRGVFFFDVSDRIKCETSSECPSFVDRAEVENIYESVAVDKVRFSVMSVPIIRKE